MWENFIIWLIEMKRGFKNPFFFPEICGKQEKHTNEKHTFLVNLDILSKNKKN